MGNFETAFEKMYQITLNEAMILCALKEASDKVTATNLSKQTELSPSHTSKMPVSYTHLTLPTIA